MHLLSQILTTARIEAQFFRRYPKMLWAALVVSLIPALYVVIYLESMWDPAGKTASLAVAVVNLDEGMNYRNQQFNLGQDIVASLKTEARFGYQDYASAAEAQHLVRSGKLAFALIIPADFSRNAVPGELAGAAKPVIYASEGNNYQTSVIASQFASTLDHQINENLNQQRWALVLNEAVGSQAGIEKLQSGVAQLLAATQQLHQGSTQAALASRAIADGSKRLDGGVSQFTSGFSELADGLREMNSSKPPQARLNRLTTGAQSLAAGHVQLEQGLDSLRTGSTQLLSGVASFQESATGNLFVPDELEEGLHALDASVRQLDSGIAAAQVGQRSLLDGAVTLSSGVKTLTGNVSKAFNELDRVVKKLPEDTQLKSLSNGADELAKGSEELALGVKKLNEGTQFFNLGLERLSSALPKKINAPEGSAAGLAHSVSTHVVMATRVTTSGSGFAPNVIPGALWLGAGIAAFLLHVRVLPQESKSFHRPAKVLGKLMLPSAVALMQSVFVLLTVVLVLRVPLINPLGFALTLAVASVTFLLIVFTLTLAFGDAGKGMAMILLALQLSSSGGVLPIELSGGLFAQISPWLPLTWVVKAVKATMFGGYDGAWELPLLLVCGVAAITFVLACLVGGWRYVSPANIRPALDI